MEILKEFLGHPWHYLIALFAASLSGFVTGPLLKFFTSHLEKPEELFIKHRTVEWKDLFTVTRGGGVIGGMESVLYLLAFVLLHPELIIAWLAFKVAGQFQVWGTIIKVPETIEGEDPLNFLRARKRWGDRKFQRFLLGTGFSLLNAFVIYIALLLSLNGFDMYMRIALIIYIVLIISLNGLL